MHNCCVLSKLRVHLHKQHTHFLPFFERLLQEDEEELCYVACFVCSKIYGNPTKCYYYTYFVT